MPGMLDDACRMSLVQQRRSCASKSFKENLVGCMQFCMSTVCYAASYSVGSASCRWARHDESTGKYTGMQADSIASDGHFTGYAKSSFHVAVQSTYSKRYECLRHGLAFSFTVHGLATDAVLRHVRHVHQYTLLAQQL
jgi:hypothetical protein